MQITKNYQLFINGELYNVYNVLREASRAVEGLRIVSEEDFTFEIKKEVNMVDILRTGTKTEDFSKLKNALIKKSRAKKRSKKVKQEAKVLENNTDILV